MVTSKAQLASDISLLPTREQLEAPLTPGLNYFDATPSIEALAAAIEDIGKRLHDVEEMQGLQLSINMQLTNAVKQLVGDSPKSGLILPERLNS